jgi:hypothetical protein
VPSKLHQDVLGEYFSSLFVFWRVAWQSAAVLIAEAALSHVEKLRVEMAASKSDSLEQSAGTFASAFTSHFESVVLCRVFAVLGLDELPAAERDAAAAFPGAKAALAPKTRVLSLIATRGRKPSWNDRKQSQGHRAVPLVDRSFVQGAPMIAKLLSDLEVDLASLDEGKPIATRRMLGGTNMTFYVPDAPGARDALGRPIIPARDFVSDFGIRTVFGMGGAYAGGQLVVSIVFTSEAVERTTADRFPNLIGSFKMNTAALVNEGRIFAS